MRTLLVGFLGATALAVSTPGALAQAAFGNDVPAPAEKARDCRLHDLAIDQPVGFEKDLLGKQPVVVEFGSTTSLHTRDRAAREEVAKEYAGKVQFILILVDKTREKHAGKYLGTRDLTRFARENSGKDSKAIARDFIASLRGEVEVNFRVLVDLHDQAFSAYGSIHDAGFILLPDGTIAHRESPVSADGIRIALEEIFTAGLELAAVPEEEPEPDRDRDRDRDRDDRGRGGWGDRWQEEMDYWRGRESTIEDALRKKPSRQMAEQLRKAQKVGGESLDHYRSGRWSEGAASGDEYRRIIEGLERDLDIDPPSRDDSPRGREAPSRRDRDRWSNRQNQVQNALNKYRGPDKRELTDLLDEAKELRKESEQAERDNRNVDSAESFEEYEELLDELAEELDVRFEDRGRGGGRR